MIKLYLDEDVHKKIAAALRLKGYDAVSAHEVGNWGLTDAGQMEYSLKEGRAIFTYNSGDFAKLHKEYADKAIVHFGILTSRQVPFSETVRRLTKFLYNRKVQDIRNGFFWI